MLLSAWDDLHPGNYSNGLKADQENVILIKPIVWNCTIILAYVAGTSKFKAHLCCAASNGGRSIHLPIIRDIQVDSYIKGFIVFSLL